MLKSPSQSSALMITRKVTQVTLLLAIVILLAGGGGLYLLNNKIGDAQKAEAAKEAEVGSNKQIAGRYQTALATFDQAESRLQYLEASLPQNQYVPTLLEQLQSLAKSTDLVVQEVRPSAITQAMAAAPTAPSTGGGGGDGDAPAPSTPKQVPLSYSTMNVELTVNGTYAHIMRFIYDLPHFPKILSVQSIALHPDQGSLLNAKIAVTAYVFDPSQDISIPQPLQRVLQENGIPQPPVATTGAQSPAPGASAPAPVSRASANPPIAGANVQAALTKSGVMSPEARAVGVARNDAAIANEQAKGQGILTPASDNAPATPNGQGGTR